jgi:hypothetical protein
MFAKTVFVLATAMVAAGTTGALAMTKMKYSSNPAYDVFVGNTYIGSDPDPFIRSQLRRDYYLGRN